MSGHGSVDRGRGWAPDRGSVASTRLLGAAGLPRLQMSAIEIERARELALRHGMTRPHEVDLADPVITWVERFGDRPAVVDETRSLSYAELAVEARRLATLLSEAGVAPGTVVGVGGERCATVIAAFLAIELIGALYVPADTTWPAARVRDVLSQADAKVLLNVDVTGSVPALLEGATEAGCAVLRAADAAGCAPWVGEPLLESIDRARYVLFTSGSTGKPKGAVVEHQGMLNHLWAKVIDLEMTEADVLAQTAPLGFDISVWQMLCPLLLGGQVHVISDAVGHDPVAFARAIDGQGITIVELVPTMVRHLLDDLVEGALRGLRWMIATGEELPTELSRRWLEAMPHTRLLNAYGPTECSDDVTHHTVTHADLELLRLPIGTPIVNSELYVLRREDDDTWTACDIDEVGELFVGGVCVGRGYLGDHERTRDAFFQDPIGPVGVGPRQGAGENTPPTGRLYRTGDAVKLLPSGVGGRSHGGETGCSLQYLGRVDRQVKISGVRMELGEIEAVLQRHPGVGAVAVVVHEFAAGE